MGRYDFRPIQVLRTAHQLRDTGRVPTLPPWHRIIAEIPPGQTIVRPVKRFDEANKRTSRRGRTNRDKASRMFQPLPIVYPEDKLRSTFFNDHPWELARPRMVLEAGGDDGKEWDWSRIQQSNKALDGESVVRRQMWLIKHHKPQPGEIIDAQTIEERAYDQARKEFYKLRLEQDVEREVAREEAQHWDRWLPPTEIEKAFKWEDNAYEDWRKWALEEADAEIARNAGDFGPDLGLQAPEEEEEVVVPAVPVPSQAS